MPERCPHCGQVLDGDDGLGIDAGMPARWAGYNAGYSGEGLEACPHTIDWLRQHWEAGWRTGVRARTQRTTPQDAGTR